VDDSTGKGLATERLVEDRLLLPYLPPGFKCVKGEVVQTGSNVASPPIDRIVYSERACPPLLVDETHSVVPIECTAGVVEITMRLDGEKLKKDIARTKVVRSWRTHRYLVPQLGSSTLVNQVEATVERGCRCFVIGLPANPNWTPEAIVDTFLDALAADGGTHVHALYVLGIGVFEKLEGKVRAWLGPDCLFRFVSTFRNSFGEAL
jgi:hypothetical protein